MRFVARRRVEESRRAVSHDGIAGRERRQRRYARLAYYCQKYPDIAIKTYPADFLSVVPQILSDIPPDAFAFFLVDPKGWRIPLVKLQPLLARQKSEVIFNFMFEFINRAASMDDPIVIKGLDELMPHGNWRQRLVDAEKAAGRALTSEERKEILFGAFAESLRRLAVINTSCQRRFCAR